ncbi:hypothetical protein ACH4OW_11220 [Streptomyces sp. NPDC017056]|uniref:hypothetical protein n=1 Tax=Streptomyces sp. NPDC017056 TaxID=3364973 RepID=UPI0037A5241F
MIGAGTGVLVTPLLNAVLSRVRPAEIGMASGVLSTGQQVGGSVGVAAVGVIFYGTLGDAPHHDTGTYAHALTAALIFTLTLSLTTSALLHFLPGRAPRDR